MPLARERERASIKAIPTRYRSHSFRSRLEARWAVVFDAMGLSWEYEPQGFLLPSGASYLPDFKVTLSGGDILWAEVKPEGGDVAKFEEFIASMRDNSLGVVLGEIPDPAKVDPFTDQGNWDVFRSGSDDAATEGGWYDNFYMFCGCSKCGAIGFEFSGRAERISCACLDGERTCNGDEHHPVLRAFAAGRSARFEHGESGATFR